MCVKINIGEKSFEIGCSELICWNFSTLNRDGSDNYRFAEGNKKDK